MKPGESAVKCSLLTIEETIKRSGTDKNNGLTTEEAVKRQEKYGKNVLPSKESISIWSVIKHQFKNPLIYILLIASVVTAIIGEIKDTVFILVVVLINTVLGTQQEWSAEKSAASLLNYLEAYAPVIRGGKKETLNIEELVPGDIMLLRSGDKVPADLRLIKTKNLTIDEAVLTGESIPTEKDSKKLKKASVINDCSNIAFAGTQVITGRATGVVVRTGSKTEVGKIAETVYSAEDVRPPLLQRTEKFAKQIGIVVLGISVIMGAIALFQGYSYIEVFMLAVALAVSAIPEGLPIAVTVALSISTRRMAKRNVVVRKLAAVESLGSCTLIASDKTGTLTLNRQTAAVIIIEPGKKIDLTGSGQDSLKETGIDLSKRLNSDEKLSLAELGKAITLDNEAELYRKDDGWEYNGSSIEVAMLSLANKLGLKPLEIREKAATAGEIPFESDKKYSAKFYREDSSIYIAAKGAPEVIVSMCSKIKIGESVKKIDGRAVEKEAYKLGSEGYRVIAVAGGEVDAREKIESLEKGRLSNLTFLGLIGFMDPLRTEVKESIEKAYEAGVEVVMITGDNPGTAFAIAKELEITKSKKDVITGSELGGDDEEFNKTGYEGFLKKVKRSKVFARVSPMQKLNIVEALQKIGNFVAVTGDGINDTPALKKANIGVAMGSGTDVTKDISSIIITDDSFSSIVRGIEEGRFAYDNIRKVTYLLISTGLAEVILFIFALLMQLPLALLPVQLLWLNLVTNGIQDVTLAFEKGEPEAMSRPPRKPREGIFNKLMIQETVLSGAIMGGLASVLWFMSIRNGMEAATARNTLLMLMVLMQNFHVFNCRSEKISAFRVPISRNYILILGIIAAQGIHIGSMYIPFMQNLLGIGPIDFTCWLTLSGIASIIILVMEIFKAIKKGLQGRMNKVMYSDV